MPRCSTNAPSRQAELCGRKLHRPSCSICPRDTSTIGQPNKITTIFGRKITKQHKGKLQTVIEDIELPYYVFLLPFTAEYGDQVHSKPGTFIIDVRASAKNTSSC